MDEITEAEARILERCEVLEMARLILSMRDELMWISTFAAVRAADDGKTFARVNRGALRNISERASIAARSQGQ